MKTDASITPPLSFPKKLIGRHGNPIQRVNEIIAARLGSIARPRVLEAGCGSTSHIRIPGSRYLVGIDISQRQLDRNQTLNERYCADIQKFEPFAQGFDLIVCWDVIEHLPQPTQALERLADALKPGGLLLLAFPNIHSLKGAITRYTPQAIHDAFYRFVIGDKRSAAEWDQFPTTMRPEIAMGRLQQWAASKQLSVHYEEVYEGPVQTHMRARSAFYDVGFNALGIVSRALTFGKVDLGLSDCILVLTRN